MDGIHTKQLNTLLKNKRIVITGGSGFIGSHLIKRLLAFPCAEIHSIDNETYGSVKRLPHDERLYCHHADLRLLSFDAIKKMLSPSTIVIHLAAEKYNQSKHDAERVIDTNCLATYKLIRACAEQKVQKLIFSSSLYAYGKHSDIGFTETQKTKPHTMYGHTKITGEALLQWLSLTYGIPTVALRLFFVYGPGQYEDSGYKSVIYKNFKRLLNNEAPTICGTGTQSLDYVYIDDVIDAFLKAILYPQLTNIFNIGSGKAYTINELTTHMSTLCNSTATPLHLPPDQTEHTHRFSASTKAAVELNFKSKTALITGLQNTLSWIKSNA